MMSVTFKVPLYALLEIDDYQKQYIKSLKSGNSFDTGMHMDA